MNISSNWSGVKKFWIDKNGVFWLDGETQCYKISSGSFDYQYLKAIYEDSKNITLWNGSVQHEIHEVQYSVPNNFFPLSY